MASLVDVSLDDVISQTRTSRRIGGGAGGRGRQAKVGNPNGRWTHDLFDSIDTSITSARPQNPRKKVLVLLSNLSPAFTQSDLEELIEGYGGREPLVHFTEDGQHAASAQFVTTAENASAFATEFRGVLLDGIPLKIRMADDGPSDSSIRNRLQFPRKEVGGRAVRGRVSKPFSDRKKVRKDWNQHDNRWESDEDMDRNARRRNIGGGGRGGRVKKPEVTQMDLDKELEEYMKS